MKKASPKKKRNLLHPFQMVMPDLYVDHFESLDPLWLKERGIRLLLCDVDNTLVAFDDPLSNGNVIRFLEKMHANGIDTALVSNNFASRVNGFAKGLPVRKVYSFALKPSPLGLGRALMDFSLKPSQVALLGDQLYTDMLGANLMHMTSILCAPCCNRERPDTKIMRQLERIAYHSLEKQGLLKKGTFDFQRKGKGSHTSF